MPNILVIEDEPDIAEAIAERLRSHGYQVEVAHDGLTGLERARRSQPDLVVLDLLLPVMSGHEVCRQLHAESRTPVLMLTALDDETDMLVGLRMGADDYITKPFSPRELVARVEAILRRVGAAADQLDASGPSPLQLGPLELDEPTRRVFLHGVEVHLTQTEFNLLLVLVEAGGAVLSRGDLLFKAWGYADDAGSRTVDSHVRAIRRKVGDWSIRTVHGVGYAVGEPGAVDEANAVDQPSAMGEAG